MFENFKGLLRFFCTPCCPTILAVWGLRAEQSLIQIVGIHK
jgi:hypothetical protein